MKQYSALLLLILLGGCKATTNNEHPPILEGNWVLNEYVENLETTKSLKKTHELTDFYCTEMIFNSAMDSVVVFNGQKGYSTLPIVENDENYYLSFRANSTSELFFDRKDSTLFFADSTLNRVFRYSRIPSSELDTTLDIPVGMPLFVNKYTLQGKWEDDYNNLITFDSNGKVKNWDLYEDYMVFYNPSVVENVSGDLLLLKSGEEIEHLYGMTLNLQELVLFDLKPSRDSAKYKHGAVKFRFRPSSAQQ